LIHLPIWTSLAAATQTPASQNRHLLDIFAVTSITRPARGLVRSGNVSPRRVLVLSVRRTGSAAGQSGAGRERERFFLREPSSASSASSSDVIRSGRCAAVRSSERRR